MTKSITDIQSIQELIDSLSIKGIQVWCFEMSLNRVLIRLFTDNDQFDYYVLMAGVTRIDGPLQWNCRHLTFRYSQAGDEAAFQVSDKEADFNMVGNGGLVLLFTELNRKITCLQDFAS